MIQGVPGASGIAIGRALRIVRGPAADGKAAAPTGDAGTELARIDAAIERTKERLRQLRAETELKLGEREAGIFAAHLAILSDPELEEEIRRNVTSSGCGAEAAVEAAVRSLADEFEALDDAYMRERAADFRDLGRTLLEQLAGAEASPLAELKEPCILIAHELTPSDTAQLPPLVRGFATEAGGAASHAAIMARSLGLPAVVGARGILDGVRDGDPVIVDGFTGEIRINPPAHIRQAYERRKAEWEAEREADRSGPDGGEAVTLDGRTVALGANIGSAAEADNALNNGAEEIGLFRTEFMYMGREREPDEEEQTRQYAAVFRAMGERPVTLRTLDIGGDKELPYLGLPSDPNPFLGWRAIRLCLDRPGLFETQLRAMLRAGAGGHLRIMFPMISTVSELRRAKEAAARAAESLRREGYAVPERWEAGIMIEIPSAALLADVLAAEADFFSIGTNDLTQYTLAVDRMNERIADLYDPYHPAVLRLIRHVVESARAHGKRVGVCGEMAGDSAAVPLLVGLGVDELSMSAPSIPAVRRTVRGLRHREAAELAQAALRLEDGRQVRELLARGLPSP